MSRGGPNRRNIVAIGSTSCNRDCGPSSEPRTASTDTTPASPPLTQPPRADPHSATVRNEGPPRAAESATPNTPVPKRGGDTRTHLVQGRVAPSGEDQRCKKKAPRQLVSEPQKPREKGCYTSDAGIECTTPPNAQGWCDQAVDCSEGTQLNFKEPRTNRPRRPRGPFIRRGNAVFSVVQERRLTLEGHIDPESSSKGGEDPEWPAPVRSV